MSEHLSLFISKMEREGLSPLVVDTFAYYYHKIVQGETGLISDMHIECVDFDDVYDLKDLKEYEPAGEKFFKNTVRIVLNGGLGTTMGLTFTKSLVEIKSGKTFLEIILQQSKQQAIKLALMNSFSTHQDTLSLLSKLKPANYPSLFLQNKFPKVLQADLKPATWAPDPNLEWNPPGHGDVFTALSASGLLQSLIDEGITYAFISNSDNLGASVDAAILGFIAANKIPFLMEIAQRAPSDLKGGHLARYKNGRMMLREAAQCPQEELEAFRDLDCYRFFNTNNIWINLVYLKNLIAHHKTVHLPMILNPKPLDPRDKNSPPVFQVETAMGTAISLFENAIAITVPKSRFFPVKTCGDLLAIRSDLFLFTEKTQLRLNPKAVSDTIRIQLDPNFYGRLDLMDARFKSGVPSLVGCESLTIDGDVRFEEGVTIKGKATIKNGRSSQAVIKEDTVIEGTLIL